MLTLLSSSFKIDSDHNSIILSLPIGVVGGSVVDRQNRFRLFRLSRRQKVWLSGQLQKYFDIYYLKFTN
jgi:hypothetical protein